MKSAVLWSATGHRVADCLGPLPLGVDRKPLHFLPFTFACIAHCGLDRQKGEKVHPAEELCSSLQVLEGKCSAVPEEEERHGVVARLELEVAGYVDEGENLFSLCEARSSSHPGKLLVEGISLPGQSPFLPTSHYPIWLGSKGHWQGGESPGAACSRRGQDPPGVLAARPSINGCRLT